jgi:signal peptidase II
MTAPMGQRVRATRIRVALTLLVLALLAINMLLKNLAEITLADGHGPDFGVLQLRLAHNSGVAFSLGVGLPAWVVTSVTGLITLALAIYGWRTAPTTRLLARIALAALLAGALANLADRASDGVVTGYLHTGWWPTFTLADTLIVIGGVLLALSQLRTSPSTVEGR